MPHWLYSPLLAITDIGDSAVLAAIVAVSAAYLWVNRCRKGAAALLLSFVAASLIVALIKILFLGCGASFRRFGIESPSGHAALSLAVFMTCALLIADQLKSWRRLLPILLLGPLCAAIAVSRVALGLHSRAEVAIGLLAGNLAFWLAAWFMHRGESVPPFRVGELMISLALAALLFHGMRLPAEAFIHLIAAQVRTYTHCG